VVQNVFLTVIEGIETFTKDGKPASFRRWLKAITRYKVLEYWADPERKVLVNADPPDTRPRLGGCGSPISDLRSLVKLIRSDWSAFWERYVEERSADDVATELGISSCEVERAVSRVLKCLRQEDEDGVSVGVLILRGVLHLIQLDFEDRTFQAFCSVALGGHPAQDVADMLGMTTAAAVHTAKSKVLKRVKQEFRALGLFPDEGKMMAADGAAVTHRVR
jgi:DNA-directed RNA polymerase specialized sigma24 family protein